MNSLKTFSRTTLLTLLFWQIAACAATLAALFVLLPDPAVQERLKSAVTTAILPVGAGIAVAFGLLAWLFLRRGAAKMLAQEAASKTGKTSKAETAEQGPRVDKKALENRDKRLYLHLFAVLQREGRLMDFFAEDLAAFDDEQIGAAVRSIQENCKKTFDKLLAPAAVMDSEEGSEVQVPAGFDPNAVKLTGNVTGDPPFKGILRHKGWRAAKLEVPQLTPAQDAHIIAPAEVEVS